MTASIFLLKLWQNWDLLPDAFEVMSTAHMVGNQ
jgi:hypothetical protein